MAAWSACQVGCVSTSDRTVPASRLPMSLRCESKNAKVPINLAFLRQDKPREHLIGPGDLLGIYVHGVVPPQLDQAPLIHSEMIQAGPYYPPHGSSHTPKVGLPMDVQGDGTLVLPQLEPIRVVGLTIPQTLAAIRKAYIDKGVLQPANDRVIVTLIKSRVVRVLVMREDSSSPNPTLIAREQIVYNKRGSAAAVDLPAFENDVLHALAATGGLPGTDAHNRVWILRRGATDVQEFGGMVDQIHAGESPNNLFQNISTGVSSTCIPLRVFCDEPLPFGPQDVILHEGDIVYLEAREDEYFYTGGLLPGGRIPLPRDQDLDVIEAVAIANGAIGSPAVGGSGGQNVVRSGAGPGNVLVAPTRAIIVRKLPTGQQVRIRVDLNVATRDSKERILMQPDDLLMLQFKPSQVASNTVLNWFTWNVTALPTSMLDSSN